MEPVENFVLQEFSRAGKLLTEISVLPLEEQLNELRERHLIFRGREEQIDDILVVGVKIKA